jgi:hypothetical protein
LSSVMRNILRPKNSSLIESGTVVLIKTERGENGGSYLSPFLTLTVRAKVKAFQAGAAAIYKDLLIRRFTATALQLLHRARTTHTTFPFPPSLQALDANSGGINARQFHPLFGVIASRPGGAINTDMPNIGLGSLSTNNFHWRTCRRKRIVDSLTVHSGPCRPVD